MDYTMECILFNSQYIHQDNEERLKMYDSMIDNVIEGCTQAQFIQEASNVVKKTKGALSRFFEFIARIFKKFSEGIMSIFRDDTKWLEENKNTLITADYSKLTLEMIPFSEYVSDVSLWGNEINKIKNQRPSNVKDAHKSENIRKAYFSRYIDSTGDLANGAKNYYRTGNANGPYKPMAYKGGQLKNHVSKMIAYCLDFDNIIKKLELEKGKIEKYISIMENELSTRDDKDEVKESFSDILKDFFNGDYVETVLEANEQPKNGQEQKPTNPVVTNNSNESSNEEKDGNKDDKDEEELKNKVKNDDTSLLVFYKNFASCFQILFAAKLTVAEERYKANMNGLRSLYKEVKNGSDPTNTKTK